MGGVGGSPQALLLLHCILAALPLVSHTIMCTPSKGHRFLASFLPKQVTTFLSKQFLYMNRAGMGIKVGMGTGIGINTENSGPKPQLSCMCVS